VRRAASLVVWFVLLFGFWELLVGTFQLSELIAGLIAAAVGALFAELVRSLGLLRFRVAPGDLPKVLKLAFQLPVELLVITWALAKALAHRRRVRGRWLTVEFDGREPGRRALAAVVGTASPNAIVVDAGERQALLHSLEPNLPGGRETL
jgi:multisubunit Na+/H+ antiporter MnhE subunit